MLAETEAIRNYLQELRCPKHQLPGEIRLAYGKLAIRSCCHSFSKVVLLEYAYKITAAMLKRNAFITEET